MTWLAATTVLALLVAPPLATTPEAEQEAEQLWQQNREGLEAAGLTRNGFRAYFHWLELQYHLGYCHRYLAGDDLVFWRLWWKDHGLDRTHAGRALLKMADDAYYDGQQDRMKKPPSQELCQRILSQWEGEMRAIVAVE